jgi:hypothetical protein
VQDQGSEPVRTVLATAPFSMVGVTWSGSAPDTVALRVRTGLPTSPRG